MRKRFAAIIAMALVSSFCLFANGQAESVAAPAASVSTGFQKNATAGAEGWKPFEKNVTITVPVYDRSKQGYPAVDNNYWTQWVQKNFGDAYNITVKYVPIPRGDVMTKYSMLIASGDTPTIMMEYDYPKVAQWANDGAMQEVNFDDFKNIAPNYFQKMVDKNQLSYSKINGKNFFVLSECPYYDTTFSWVTFVRMDWLRAVGYDHVPASYAEQCDAMDKIIKAGLTDQAPVGLSLPTAAYVQNYAFRDLPLDEKEWAMNSSLGTPSLSWEPTKKFLKRYNDEYHKGWYSSEFDLDADGSGGGTSSQQKTDFINGKTYSYGGYIANNMDWLTAFYKNNPKAELAIASNYAVVEPGVVNQPTMRINNSFGMIVGFSKDATPDQLKAAWMYMEWMLQDKTLSTLENGVEGVTYKLNAKGLPEMINVEGKGVKEMLNHNNNIDMTCIVHNTKKVGTIEDTISSMAPVGLPQDFTQSLIDNYYELKKIADNGWAYTDPIFSVSIDSESEYSATLLRLWQSAFSKLVKCAPADFDALYDKLSKEFLDAGYQEVIDERLKAYEDGNCTHLPDAISK